MFLLFNMISFAAYSPVNQSYINIQFRDADLFLINIHVYNVLHFSVFSMFYAISNHPE